MKGRKSGFLKILIAVFILILMIGLNACWSENPASTNLNEAPVIQKTSGPDSGSTISVNHATFGWSGSDATVSRDRSIAKYQIRKDTDSWTDNSQAGTSYEWTGISEGSHTFSVKAFDDEATESNVVSWSFTYRVPATTYTLSIEATPAAGGDVSFDNSSWTDEASQTVNEGTQVTLYAATETGYTFDGWYEDGNQISTANPYNLTVNANRELEAKFSVIATVPETVQIEGGTFEMGDTKNKGSSNEKPVHTVTLTYDYEIGKYEMTNAQFLEFLNDAGVNSTGQLNGHVVIDSSIGEFGYSNGTFSLKKSGKGHYPVIYVTWWGSIAYCNWLSQKEGIPVAYDTSDGSLLDENGASTTNITAVKGYRLPTEAEWEYAARGGQHDISGGTEAHDFTYAGSNTIDDVGWYKGNSDNPTYPIYEGTGTQKAGTKAANEAQIHDMSGNVFEWCQDGYNGDYYVNSPSQNPLNFTDDYSRVYRGGCWILSAFSCRVSHRSHTTPGSNSSYVGFRLARTR